MSFVIALSPTGSFGTGDEQKKKKGCKRKSKDADPADAAEPGSDAPGASGHTSRATLRCLASDAIAEY